MKNKIIKSTENKLRVVIGVLFLLISLIGVSQNIGINTMGNAPNSSAALDIDINQKGLLVPRMSTANRNAIVAPAHSLLIYNTTTDCFEAWNQTTLIWVAFGCISCQLPGAFSASAATSITQTSFSANWNASVGATTYFLDVATDAAFTAFVAGYNNLNVGNVVTSSVTGLTCGTTYYYRVRANNSCGTSANSNIVTAITISTMSITTDNGSGNITNGTATSLTGSFTVGIGSNRILFVANNGNIGADLVTGVTYAGIAMTLISAVQKPSDRAQSFWYLLNPPSGANNIVITNSSSSYTEMYAVSLSGVKQQAPEAIGTTVTGTGTSFSASVTTVSVNSWALGILGCGVNTATAGANTTLLTTMTPFNIAIAHRSDDPQGTPGSKTLNWNAGISSPWAGTVVSIAPATCP